MGLAPSGRAVLCALLVGAAASAGLEAGPAGGWADGLSRFFDSVDGDGDGQIEHHEAEAYIGGSVGGSDFDTSSEVGEGAAASLKRLDGGDASGTVSRAELEAHLRSLLTAQRVEEWIAEGIGLPQHAAAFRANAITALDFPTIVEGGAEGLVELGVTSRLHQTQLLRALKRQVLGLGEVPSPARAVRVHAEGCAVARLEWDMPERVGLPPLHAYAVQRQEVGRSPRYKTIARLSPEDDRSFVDELAAPAPNALFRYRVVAWAASGRSEATPVEVTLPLCSAAEVAAFEDNETGSSDVRNTSRSGKGRDGARLSWWNLATTFAVIAGVTLRYAHVGASLWQTLYRRLPMSPPASPTAAGALVNDSLLGAADKRRWSSAGSLDEGGLVAQEAARARSASQTDSAGVALHRGSSAPLLADDGESPVLLATRSAPIATRAEFVWEQAGNVAPSEPPSPRNAAEPVVVRPINVNCCGAEECHVRWDRWNKFGDIRMRFKKHHCAMCQGVFCVPHTRISPHGTSGRCSLQSKCYCTDCFESLDAETQAALERTNKLPKRVDQNSSPAKVARYRWQRALSEVDMRRSDTPVKQQPGDTTPPTEPSPPPPIRTSLRERVLGGMRKSRSKDSLEQMVSDATQPGREARSRWKRASRSMSAMLAFKRAGRQSVTEQKAGASTSTTATD